jgi:hypothetical protein
MMIDTTACPTQDAADAVLRWLANLEKTTELVTYFP